MPPALPKADSLLTSTVGRKAVMAVTGVVLFGYVLGHMAGNLQVFLGPEAINAYGKFLHEVVHGTGIWIVRAVLSACLVLHVWAAWSLTATSRNARPVGYKMVTHRESTYASRTMRWGGPLILLFVIYHLLDLTIGRVNPGFVPGDVYRNLVASFHRPVVAAFYIAAMVALGLHLQHGVWSMLQTLGASHPRYDPWRKAASTAFAVVVCGGFIVVPLAILAGFVR
jgi:succinate dehydrogenase / fumarate reductase cytochrome b subunit